MPPSAASLSAPVSAEEPDTVVSTCRRFCVIWFFGVVLLVAVIGAFNALVDPYLVMGTPRLAGLNAAKPEATTHTQLAKDYLLGRVRPAGLLLGTSKVDLGLDPRSPFWPDNARPAFNYGVPGTSIRGNLADLQRAVALGTVRRVLVVLEFVDFMPPSTRRPVSREAMTPLRHMQDIVLATLSLDAFRASIATIIAQQQAAPLDLSPEGATNDQ